MNIYELIQSKSYDFIRDNPNLKDIILLTYGGSYAYGMNVESSDIDLRGIALNSKKQILLGEDFEQVVEVSTDTVIYSFNKILKLLASCNPNTVEILGCNPEHYFIRTDIGQQLLDNRKLFVSKLCIHTFGGYAHNQLRRLENRCNHASTQIKDEQNILKSIESAMYDFKHRYTYISEDGYLNLYIDKSTKSDIESEIFLDVKLHHYPLRDWTGMWSEMKAITTSYTKMGRRNANAINHDKLSKHMAHLVRLYLMGIDMLEKGEIITYRSKDHDLLMKLRNGEYLDDNYQPIEEFYQILNEYEKRFNYACKNTSIPDIPDWDNINEFKMSVNESIIKGE